MLLCNRMAGVWLAGARRASRRLRPSWGAGDIRTLGNEAGCKRNLFVRIGTSHHKHRACGDERQAELRASQKIHTRCCG